MFGCHRYHQDWPLGAMCNEMKRVIKWIVKIHRPRLKFSSAYIFALNTYLLVRYTKLVHNS